MKTLKTSSTSPVRLPRPDHPLRGTRLKILGWSPALSFDEEGQIGVATDFRLPPRLLSDFGLVCANTIVAQLEAARVKGDLKKITRGREGVDDGLEIIKEKGARTAITKAKAKPTGSVLAKSNARCCQPSILPPSSLKTTPVLLPRRGFTASGKSAKNTYPRMLPSQRGFVPEVTSPTRNPKSARGEER